MPKGKILVIQGPNLNLLGVREPEIYGEETIEDINYEIVEHANENGFECDVYMSNIEGEIINAIHSVMDKYDGIIINAGAYTHYSLAIHDAIAGVSVPTVEVHISNIFKREEYRHKSVIAPVCVGSICGFGKYSYFLAIDAIINIL